MGLQEIALGGIYLSPLLAYALLGLLVALILRALLYRLPGTSRPWFEAWFDTALFVICTAAIAYLAAFTDGTL
ncbi:DUF1656 domain-containing protein [Halomonas saccharevitans]|uniref:DUF1656 domain-containing protein n=1 Tax=Halomonas saccharevitans TaxID=416872 RepID=A0A1I7C4C6_9GAMM|nr:DUF1656 domain-containing protein [Halomonas saccharevitans]MDT8880287.1 DUF1656 domain-containing protein [Halomonas saccharevitans]SFT94224.1 Protein of unknown function [Halomonas saccharevitans]